MGAKASSFQNRAAAQQAQFRQSLSVQARSPADPQGQRHPHLLALGCELENLYPAGGHPAAIQDFFRNREIKWWKSTRSGDSSRTGKDSPTRNLSSSQVCCVNFLFPLAQVPGALLAFLRFIDQDVVEIIPVTDGDGHTSEVEFEWVGWQTSLENGLLNRGALQTSTDALIIARTHSGSRAYLIEWKYSEQYLGARDKAAGSKTSAATLTRRYLGLFQQSGSSFKQSCRFESFHWEPFYQLMRLQLLADKITRHGVTRDLKVDEASLVVVCPAANEAYRQVVRRTPLGKQFPAMNTVEEIMRATLKRPERFSMPSQEQIVAHLRRGPLAQALAPWLAYHQRRYGW